MRDWQASKHRKHESGASGRPVSPAAPPRRLFCNLALAYLGDLRGGRLEAEAPAEAGVRRVVLLSSSPLITSLSRSQTRPKPSGPLRAPPDASSSTPEPLPGCRVDHVSKHCQSFKILKRATATPCQRPSDQSEEQHRLPCNAGHGVRRSGLPGAEF